MHTDNLWTLGVDALVMFPRYDEFKDRASRRIQIPKGRHRFDFRLSLAPTTPGMYVVCAPIRVALYMLHHDH